MYSASAADAHVMRLVKLSACATLMALKLPAPGLMALEGRAHPTMLHTGAGLPPAWVSETSTRAGASPGIVTDAVTGVVSAPTVMVWRAPLASGPTGTV